MKLRETGAELQEDKDTVRLTMPATLRGTDVRTLPFPGFPTDMQAQFVALMSLAEGTSVVTETVFESRFMHVEELRRMGADIRVEGNRVVVTGRKKLTGAPVMASDLRASAGLIVAGFAAEGMTQVQRVYHLDRGYERIEEKLGPWGPRWRRRRVDDGDALRAAHADDRAVKRKTHGSALDLLRQAGYDIAGLSGESRRLIFVSPENDMPS